MSKNQKKIVKNIEKRQKCRKNSTTLSKIWNNLKKTAYDEEKQGRNHQIYRQTVKIVEKPGRNGQKYQKIVKNIEKPSKISKKGKKPLKISENR